MRNYSFKGKDMIDMHNLLVESGWTYFGGSCYALDNTKAKIQNLHLVCEDNGYKLWSSTEVFAFETFYIESKRDVNEINSICLL